MTFARIASFALATMVVGYSAKAAEPTDEAYKVAARRLAAGRAKEAVAAFGNRMKDRPGSVEGHYQCGLDWRGKEKRIRAINEFGAALAINPNHAPSLASRGLMQFELNKLDQAKADAEAAIRADPENAFGYFVRGRIFGMPGYYEPDKVRADMTKAIECDPEMAWAYCLRTAGWNGTAADLPDLNKAIELDPREAHFYEARAWVYGNEGHPEEALRDYNQAVEADPKHPEYRTWRAECRLTLKDKEGALADADKILRMNPESSLAARARQVRGRVFNQMHRHEDALAEFEKVIKAEPDWSIARFGRAHALLALGNPIPALKDINRAKLSLQRDPNVVYLRALILLAMDRFGPAAREAREGRVVANADPELAAYLTLLAYVAERRNGKEKQASDLVEEIVKKLDQKRWPFPIAEFLLERRAAVDVIKSATDDEQRAEANSFIGFSLAMSGKAPEALPYLQPVLEKANKASLEYLVAVSSKRYTEAFGVTH
jgi:tetratricopeptide (TPR) repeat protein